MTSIGNRLTLMLLLACSGLGVALWQQTRQAEDATQTHSTPSDEPPDASQARNLYRPPPLVSFREISQRPLFLSERRPPEPPKVVRKPPPAPVMPLNLILEGIVLSSREKVAMLLNIRNSEVMNLTIGMQHQGWELVEIDKNRVRFERGGQSQELSLIEE